ncbi:TetR/AcrR family transcriptional regulator [Mycobacterium kyogaense]|uniref:TetR/AcrR family transcriptional regulator n=1 Tax=Mycobacterium kyogaense TaxID=2212479 RepID=UPI000DAC59CE|nr:TetR/AcrR family transcriptional regulator [Mycobacterium kyogaense]
MSGRDWLAAQRTEIAAERILDAAGELFAGQPAATVGMHEIASAAGCSRATLYRYFENREALHTAYVHRETHRIYRELTDELASITDPEQRLVQGMLRCLRMVRENPALASWFTASARPLGGEMAEQSPVIATLTEMFVGSLGFGDRVEQRARWLVRVLTSFLVFPGRDEGDEAEMLAEFVVPRVVTPG